MTLRVGSWYARRLVRLVIAIFHVWKASCTLELLDVVKMLVGLHMYAKVSFSGCGIVTDFTSVWFVTTGIGLSSS
jgi:hypothetical protein